MEDNHAMDVLKDVIEAPHGHLQQDNLNGKRPTLDETTKSDKRIKTDGNGILKEVSTLSDVNSNNQGGLPLALNNSFPFGYGYNTLSTLPYAFSQGSSGIMDPEQIQQILLQQHQMRYMDQGIKEIMKDGESATATIKKRRSKTPVLNTSSAVAYASTQYSGRFILLEQPNVRQRKSYKNENRYILPNPLTICARESPGEKLPRILDGQVTVSLVNGDGQDLPNNKANLLDSPDGLTQQLDSNLSTHFSLKVLDTSEGTMFRLLFTATFTLESVGSYEEKILSRPFQVYSNRKKNTKGQEKPSVIDIKPKEGMATQETEIWIKGRGFSDRVVVTFGDKQGRIVEATENLLTVWAPARYDLMSDSSVSVVVSNKYPHELLSADKKLSFVYYVNV